MPYCPQSHVLFVK